MSDDWSFKANIQRGSLPTGEPLEDLYGAGWWTERREPGPQPPVIECHVCGGHAYDLGPEIDCENCGVIPEWTDEEETDDNGNE